MLGHNTLWSFDLDVLPPTSFSCNIFLCFAIHVDWAGTVGPYQYQITVPGTENDGKHAVPLPCGQFSLKIRPQPMVEKRPQPVVGI